MNTTTQTKDLDTLIRECAPLQAARTSSTERITLSDVLDAAKPLPGRTDADIEIIHELIINWFKHHNIKLVEHIAKLSVTKSGDLQIHLNANTEGYGHLDFHEFRELGETFLFLAKRNLFLVKTYAKENGLNVDVLLEMTPRIANIFIKDEAVDRKRLYAITPHLSKAWGRFVEAQTLIMPDMK